VGPSEVEDAYLALSGLLSDGDPDEDALQECFEEHDAIWACLDYVRAVAKPRLKVSNEVSLYPDFVAATRESQWEVVDLKLPTQRVVKKRRHRDSFYAAVTEGISQLRDYREYFDDSANREWFAAHHGFGVARQPRTLLIVGGDHSADLDAAERDRILGSGLERILTYDDVLNRLVQLQAEMSTIASPISAETWAGSMQIVSLTSGRDSYVFDQVSPAGDRLSLLFDGAGQLTFRIVDVDGATFSATSPDGVPVGFRTLAAVFATSDRHSVLQLAVDGQTVAIQRWPLAIEVSQSLRDRLKTGKAVIGNSVAGTEGTRMMLASCALWDQPLTFLELLETSEQLRDQKTWPRPGCGNVTGASRPECLQGATTGLSPTDRLARQSGRFGRVARPLRSHP